MPLFIVRNDIVNMTTDAIVLPANQILEEGSGTSRAIYKAAGEEKLTEACRAIGECELGKAVITDGFDLPAEYIIHAVCPKWYGGDMNEEELLRSAYLSSLDLATEYELESIAFPLLSTGNYKFPKKYGLVVAKEAIEDYLSEHDLDVYLVLYDRETIASCRILFPRIDHFIDDNYVGEKDENYYIEKDSRRDKWRRTRGVMGHFGWLKNRPEELGTYETVGTYENPGQRARNIFPVYPFSPGTGYTEDPIDPFESVDDLVRNRPEEPTFSDFLMDLIEQKGMTNVEAYKKANVSKSVFHTIWSNKHQVPKKNTVLAFAIALELNVEETNELLMKAGYAFSNAIMFDVLIQYFIKNKIYNVYEINEILYEYNQPLLGMKTT